MINGLPNIRHMRVFLETLRTGSVSQAAGLCHLSQPAATQAIRKLEQALGTPLLIRHGKSFSPTPCGALFVRRVEAALGHLQAGARNAARSGGETGRRLRMLDRQVTAAQLRALVAVANCGSFTVAARMLDLAQPTIHRAARALEALAGVPFFRATAVGVELTPAAQAFVLGAKLAQAEIRQGVEEIGRELGEDRGTFILGSLPLARSRIVPRAIHALMGDAQGVQVRVVDGRYAELLRSLREGDLDCLIGALRDPAPADDVTEERLFTDDLVIVARPDHPLADRRRVSLEDTLAFPWVAPPRDTPAGQYLFQTLRIQDRAQSPVRVVSSSLVLLRGILAQGDYLSIISRHQVAEDIAQGRMAVLDMPLRGHLRPIGLTYRRDWRPTETQARFLDHLRRFSRAPATLAAS